ncbi:uncharacterized protein UTRI_10298 [Ustilago trichophora]|uniref:Uncharacterized protein n=1 Tax=Ustilago trichophora TaxID=86804 RepID=A0A5C3EP53_9BASI|nr:uncharacterized protein UTRI_10298 [Ustilago trichophora]
MLNKTLLSLFPLLLVAALLHLLVPAGATPIPKGGARGGRGGSSVGRGSFQSLFNSLKKAFSTTPTPPTSVVRSSALHGPSLLPISSERYVKDQLYRTGSIARPETGFGYGPSIATYQGTRLAGTAWNGIQEDNARGKGGRRREPTLDDFLQSSREGAMYTAIGVSKGVI